MRDLLRGSALLRSRANCMAFSIILYARYFEQIAQSASRLLPYVLLALATPIVFSAPIPFCGRRDWLVQSPIRMEVLLSLGILNAYL